MNYSNATGLTLDDFKQFLLICEEFSNYLEFNVACQRLVLTHDDVQKVFKNIASNMFFDSPKTFKFHQNYLTSTRPNRYIILEIVSNTPKYFNTLDDDLKVTRELDYQVCVAGENVCYLSRSFKG